LQVPTTLASRVRPLSRKRQRIRNRNSGSRPPESALLQNARADELTHL